MNDVPRVISRRYVLASLASLAGLALLSACGQPAQTASTTQSATSLAVQASVAQSTAAPKAPKAAPGQITISVWGDVPDKSTYADITKSFNTAQQGVTAGYEQFLGNYYDKLQTAVVSGSAPDVLYFQGWSWQPYADKNALLPLDEYISKDKYTAPWPGIPNYTDNSKWHGKTYMSSADTGSIVMFYNKALFDKFSVPYPKDSWTYADFQLVTEKMTRKVDGVQYYGYAQAGGWNGAYGRSFPWMRMDGELEWDKVVEPKQAKFLQTDILSKLQYTVVDTISKGWCPAPSTITGGGVAIATGRVALTPEGPWYLPQMQGPKSSQKGGVPFDVVDFPKGKSGQLSASAEVHGHTITKTSKNPDAAWALLRYCTEDKAQQIIAQYGRMCNTPDTITKFWVPEAEKAFNFKTGAAFARAQQAGQTPLINGAGANMDAVSQAAGTPLTVAWDSMVNGTAAKQALDAENPAVQAILDNYWKAQKA